MQFGEGGRHLTWDAIGRGWDVSKKNDVLLGHVLERFQFHLHDSSASNVDVDN